MPVALDEVKGMRRERDEVQEKLEAVKKVSANPTTLDELERNALRQLAQLPELFNSDDMEKTRQELSRLIERVEISPDKKVRLFGQPDLLMQLGVGSNNIPSQNNPLPIPLYVARFPCVLPAAG